MNLPLPIRARGLWGGRTAVATMRDGLIDRIYECAFIPELWPGVLGELAEIATARAGFLFVSKAEIHRWACSTQVGVDALKPLVESGWVARSERFKRFLGVRDAGFVTDTLIYPTGGYDSDPFYSDILYPRGLGHAAGMLVALPTGDRFMISLERELALGPVEPPEIAMLNTLRGHVSRAATLSARLQLERAQAASQALASVGLAALVFDAAGRVIAANGMIEAMTGLISWRAQNRLALNDRKADQLLHEAIASLSHADARRAFSFPVRDGDERAAMVAHVVPIRLSAREIFTRCAGVLILTPVTAPHAPPAELVKSLFDLTPTESRVAHELAGGGAVEDIAVQSGVSANTVRTHVRGILEKTGCGRMIDLVALLTGIATVQPTSLD